MAPEKTGAPPAVVVIRLTAIDGPVLSWYRDLRSARYDRELISASRRGVMVHGNVYLHDIPPAWSEAAEEAHAALCLGQPVTHMATHVRRELIGTLKPIDDGRTVAL